MGAPKAITDQKKKVDEIQKQLAAVKNTSENTAVDFSTVADEVVPAEVVKTAADLTPKTGVNSVDDSIVVDDPGGEDYKHKYNVLKGMLETVNKEKKALSEIVSETQKGYLDLLKVKNNPATAPSSEDTFTSGGPLNPIVNNDSDDLDLSVKIPDVDITADQLGDFDDNSQKFVKKIAVDAAGGFVNEAMGNVSKEIKSLKALVNGLNLKIETMGSAVEKTSQVSYETALYNRVPDLDLINDSQDFEIWANEKEQFSGKTRLALMQAANDAEDIEKVVNIFNLFKEQHGITTVAAETVDGRKKLIAPGGPGARSKETPIETDKTIMPVGQLESELKELESLRLKGKIDFNEYRKKYAALIAKGPGKLK